MKSLPVWFHVLSGGMILVLVWSLVPSGGLVSDRECLVPRGSGPRGGGIVLPPL